MKNHSSLSQHIQSFVREAPEKAKKISFTQLSVYEQCPHRWYLTYGKGMFPFTSTIDTVFGTAMHETLQKYLEILYNDSVKASEEFKVYEFLKERLLANYNIEFEKNNNQDFSTAELLNEYYIDGCEIMKYIKKNRKSLFDHVNEELLGIEIPLMVPALEGNDTFYFNGFIDIVFRDKVNNTIRVPDFKTSGKGWGDYQKKDEVKMAQGLLYKKYLSKQYDIPEDDIEVSFMILKRKLWENSQYKQSRVNTHIPSQGKNKMLQATNMLTKFIHATHEWDGKIIHKEYPKNPGKACKFCPFDLDPVNCNKRK